MIYIQALDNDDATAQIVGSEDRSEAASFEPTPGYVYIEGDETDATHYLVYQNEWQLAQKLEFLATGDQVPAVVGTELVFDLGVDNVEVSLDGINMGVNLDNTVEFTADTAGSFTLLFEKFPYVTRKVIVNAN